MQVNNIHEQSFRGNFYSNEHLTMALKRADNLEKIRFSNVLRQMKQTGDSKIFELGIKKSKIGLFCSGITDKPQFFKLNDKIYEKETYKNFYEGVLENINNLLRRFYPKVEKAESEEEIIDSYDVLPFEMFEEQETEEILPAIHEDLLPFENSFRGEELFRRKEDLLEQDILPYSIDDVELRSDLMPEASDIEQYNTTNNNYIYGEKLLRKKSVEQQKAPKPLPDNFPAFAFDYVREFSVKEAEILYNFLQSMKTKDYQDFINQYKKYFKQYGTVYTIECLKEAVLLKHCYEPINKEIIRTVNDHFNSKLFEFILKHPDDRSLVVSDNNRGYEKFDKYGAKFYEELLNRCDDKRQVVKIYKNCQKYVPGECMMIDKELAQKALSDLGYNFSEDNKTEVINLIKENMTTKDVEKICDNIQKNKVENYTDYAKEIASVSGRMELDKGIELAEKALLHYKSSKGETIGTFNQNLMEFITKYPDCRDKVVSVNSFGEEIYDKRISHLYVQMQSLFDNKDEANKEFKSCLLPEKKGEVLLMNSKGKLFSKLLDNNFTYEEANKIYTITKDYNLEDQYYLIEKSIKHHQYMDFEILQHYLTQSILVNEKTKIGIFEPDLMEFLIKYPKDRELVISKDELGDEYFDNKKAARIINARKMEKQMSRYDTPPTFLSYERKEREINDVGKTFKKEVNIFKDKTKKENEEESIFGDNVTIFDGNTIVNEDGKVQNITITLKDENN